MSQGSIIDEKNDVSDEHEPLDNKGDSEGYKPLDNKEDSEGYKPLNTMDDSDNLKLFDYKGDIVEQESLDNRSDSDEYKSLDNKDIEEYKLLDNTGDSDEHKHIESMGESEEQDPSNNREVDEEQNPVCYRGDTGEHKFLSDRKDSEEQVSLDNRVASDENKPLDNIRDDKEQESLDRSRDSNKPISLDNKVDGDERVLMENHEESEEQKLLVGNELKPLDNREDADERDLLNNREDSDEREPLDNRGDADGSSLSSESNKVTDIVTEDKEEYIDAILREEFSENQENENNCSCKRADVRPYEENGSVLLGAWNELRSSLRQLHRSVIPSSLTKPGISNPRNRPSINRIKALSNMLLSHDPHQLFTRVNQLSQELCIELKVRLLATIHDSPDIDEALTFIKGLCESYEWVINVCETIQSAFEKLDSDHLSHFGLNWMTVNMHTFHATIFTDPDVQDYLSLCCSKTEDKEEAKDILGCLTSLKRTLSVSENVWAKAENHLQDYAMERAAFNAQRRQLLSGWGQLKSRQQPIYNKYNNLTLSSHSSIDKESVDSASIYNSVAQEIQSQQCPCKDCHTQECHKSHSPSPSNASVDMVKEIPKSCECHFCNNYSSQPQQTSSSVIPVSNVGVLPPLSQPQLLLYPHIHGTSANGEISSNQNFDDLGPLPSSSSKPPLCNNPYLGSELLTKQLLREWELTYGDTISPPGTHPQTSSGSTMPIDDTSDLTNQMENLSVNSNLPYSHTNSDSHSCVHLHQEKLASTSLPCSNSNHVGTTLSIASTQETSKYSKEQGIPSSSVITHTKNCSNAIPPHPPKESIPSDSDLSDPDDWSSDESDGFSTSSSTNHKDSHCDCCYCHMLQNKPGGGRQRYSDRRERLLKILSHKKRSSVASSSSAPNTCTPMSSSNSVDHCENENQLGKQTLDEIMNYIEGKRSSSKCHKKAAKKARQKERKLAMKRQEEKRNQNRSDDDDGDDDDDDDDDNDEYFNDLSEENEEEEEDGPLAELRRRAPDVTITVVKPGQKTSTQRTPKHQIGINRDMNTNMTNAKHPLAAKPLPQSTLTSNSMWNPPRATLPSGRLSSMPMPGQSNGPLGPKDNNTGGPSPGTASTGGLSSLLKGMESLSKDPSGDKDGKSSQMVTIRRVMDPISSEPTVTITLKGEEPKKDKVLFKLVNGQACTGNTSNAPKGQQPKKQAPKKPQEQPVYNIPEGTSPEEAKKMKKKQKKERQKQRKEQEKIEEQQREQMKQLEIQKRKEFLKQQEAHIRKQQAALERQQQELLRQQAKGQDGQNMKKGKKGKATNDKMNKENSKNKSKNISALVYDGDDVARNFSLPPGVSINKVAGQPGMVTISNNMGNQFPQPFLPNPNLYQSSLLAGYPMGSHVGNSGYPMGHGGAMGYSGIYNGCGGPMPWSGGIDPCTGNPQESVIVVDTNSGTSARTAQNFYKTPDEMTSEEKIQAAVRGEIDANTLNQTQKRKYKKCLKEFKEDEEKMIWCPTNKQNAQPAKIQTKKVKKSNESGKKSSQSFKIQDMTSEEKIEAAVRGEIDISILNQTQKKKYKKCLKVIKQEEEAAIQKQREEDELMDHMYEIARGRIPKSQIVNNTTNNNNKKKMSKASKDNKSASSHSLSVNCANSNAKQSQNAKIDKNLNKKTKQGQNGISSCSNNVNINQSISKNNPNNNSKKASEKSSKSDSKGQESKAQHNQPSQLKQQQKTQQKPVATKQQIHSNQQVVKKQSDISANNVQNQQHKQAKKNQMGVQQIQVQKAQSNKDPSQMQKQTKKMQQNFQNNSQQQQQQQQQQPHLNHKQITNQKNQKLNSVANSSNKPSRLQPNFRGNVKPGDSSINYSQQLAYNSNSYGPSVGYANSDFGHEARYAQYLAANASTLASVEYETNNMNSHRLPEADENAKKGKKRGKRGQLEDLTTIDSVFTPKELPTGELDDETDREVEAFKRFCLYSVPRNTGQKPKVNFNVKDIMIKKKH